MSSLSYSDRKSKGLTLREIKSLDRDIITPAQAAGVLKCDPHYIRVVAHRCPEQLGFPVVVLNSRTKIPRIPFIRYIEGGG